MITRPRLYHSAQRTMSSDPAPRLGVQRSILATMLCVVLSSTLAAIDPPITGPETEKRFPPLKLAAGFRATLFACDPFIEYPSAIALGPTAGSLFVAVDYMTGLGTEIVRRDEIRLIQDTDGDGYADKSTVYAGGFNSIEGLTYHDGVVFAMHSPYLTALRDVDGDGVADERRDIVSGLGLPPEENPPRLHCANGIVWGHDGWLYLALGDHGCIVERPEGDRLVLEGGGILRCRPDGRDLHVFSTGLRNIYDVALDDELNVFVRDNENDGGDYKIRVCHSFFGADHGYPYLYYERPDEALAPLADLGLGSSAGGVAYLEPQFGPEHRGNLFFCEWGRAVMRYAPRKSESGFAPIQELEFAAGAPNDPYGFKPTDLVVERDGSLIIADWGDGQRPKRGRGRIYRVRADGARAPAARPGGIAALDSPSYLERLQAQDAIERAGHAGRSEVAAALRDNRLGVSARMHAVWILAHSKPGDPALAGDSFDGVLQDIARHDPDPRVRLQAVRALADANDPALRQHRLAAEPANPAAAQRIAEIADSADPHVVREVAIALGRLDWAGLPEWAERHLTDGDAALAHAVIQSLRKSGNWSDVLAMSSSSRRDVVRSVATRAMADQAAVEVVDGLIAQLQRETAPDRRRDEADLLSRVYCKPGPWTYWGYRPAPRTPNGVEWERTAQIKQVLNGMLLDPDRSVRVAVLNRMLRERIPATTEALEAWLAEERDAARVAVIIDALKSHPAGAVRSAFERIVRDRDHATANRLAALGHFERGIDDDTQQTLLDLASTVEDGAVLADALRRAGRHATLRVDPLLTGKLKSAEAEVRAAATEALADRPGAAAGESIRDLLADEDAGVRRAAAVAVAKLKVRSAAGALLNLTKDPDAAVRRASFSSMQQLNDARVLPLALAAVNDPETGLEAMNCIGAFGAPEHLTLVRDAALRNASTEIAGRAIAIIADWRGRMGIAPGLSHDLDRAMAEIQGASGVLLRWNITGPLADDRAASAVERAASSPASLEELGSRVPWHEALARTGDPNLTVAFGSGAGGEEGNTWIALSDVTMSDDAHVQFLASSGGTLRVWLNGAPIHQRAQPGGFQPDSDRFEGNLTKGTNRVLLQVTADKAADRVFHVRFRRRASRSEHEQLVQAALVRAGNAERGGKLFFDAEKSQCIKCHRMGDRGERIGPDLTGVGNRFSRIHIIESILEPSRTLAPSFESVTVALKDGRVLTGLRVSETDATLVLADNQAAKHVLQKSDIDERRAQQTSIMPEGLEKRFTTDEFVDLITFLVSRRE
jgi:putative heme-binding domain-containing protein